MSKNDLKKTVADYYRSKSLPPAKLDRLLRSGQESEVTPGDAGLHPYTRRAPGAVIGWAALLIVVPTVGVLAYQLGYAHGSGVKAEPTTPAPQLARSQFLLALYQSPDARSQAQEDPHDRQVEEYRQWAGRIAERGLLVGGEKLTDDAGRFLSLRNGQLVVLPDANPHDGQALAGFFVVRADSYDQAVDLARTCPHVKYGSGIAIHKIDRLDTPDTRDQPNPNAPEGER